MCIFFLTSIKFISPRSCKENIPVVNNAKLLSREVSKIEAIGVHIPTIIKVHDWDTSASERGTRKSKVKNVGVPGIRSKDFKK